MTGDEWGWWRGNATATGESNKETEAFFPAERVLSLATEQSESS
jgi:hypothetical protein